jgi:hypothetical protein
LARCRPDQLHRCIGQTYTSIGASPEIFLLLLLRLLRQRLLLLLLLLLPLTTTGARCRVHVFWNNRAPAVLVTQDENTHAECLIYQSNLALLLTLHADVVNFSLLHFKLLFFKVPCSSHHCLFSQFFLILLCFCSFLHTWRCQGVIILSSMFATGALSSSRAGNVVLLSHRVWSLHILTSSRLNKHRWTVLTEWLQQSKEGNCLLHVL